MKRSTILLPGIIVIGSAIFLLFSSMSLSVKSLAFSDTPKYIEGRVPDTLPERIHYIPFEYFYLLKSASLDYDVPIDVLRVVIREESNFNKNERSPRRRDGHRDLGIGQFNSKMLPWMRDTINKGKAFDPMKPKEAIPVIAKLLRYNYERTDSWMLAIMAYNQGNIVQGNRPIATTYSYLGRVMSRW